MIRIKMAALSRSLSLLSLLCVMCLCQAHVDMSFVEKMRNDLVTSELTYEKIKEDYNSLVSQRDEMVKGNKEKINDLKMKIPKDQPFLQDMIENLKAHNEVSDQELGQKLEAMEKKIQHFEKLVKINKQYVEFLEEMAGDL